MDASEMTKTSPKRIYILPAVMVASHTVLVMIFAGISGAKAVGDPEVLWHYVFGLVDLPIHALIYPSTVGRQCIVWLGYPVYFALIGAIQWTLVGFCITYAKAWHGKSERSRDRLTLALWLVPLFSLAAIAFARFILNLAIMPHAPWMIIFFAFPFLALLISLCSKKWIVALFSGVVFFAVGWMMILN